MAIYTFQELCILEWPADWSWKLKCDFLHSILTCTKSIIQENVYYIINFVAHHFDIVARMPPAITQLLDFLMIQYFDWWLGKLSQ